MSNSTGYIYDAINNINLQNRSDGTNRIIYQNYGLLKIVKNDDTILRFNILGYNKTPTSLSNKIFNAMFIDKSNNKTILKKQMIITDSGAGLLELRISKMDTIKFNKKYYDLIINFENESNTTTVYINDNYKINFGIEIIDNYLPFNNYIYEFTSDNFTLFEDISPSPVKIRYKSNSISVRDKLINNFTTFTIYNDSPVIGELTLQANCEESIVYAPNNDDFNKFVPLIDKDKNIINSILLRKDSPKIQYFNVEGKFSEFRFLFNAQDESNGEYIYKNRLRFDYSPDDDVKLPTKIILR